MTQEEKARAYDKVVARINKAVSDGLVSENFGRDMLGIAESEDEELKNKSGYYKAGKFWKASTLWNAVKGKTPQRVPNRYMICL